MAHNDIINEGGINGIGSGIVNTNSEDFQLLRQHIQQASKDRDPIDRIEDRLLGVRFTMETYLQNPAPETLILPGEFLTICISLLGITNKTFAAYIEYKASNLSAICKGKRNITPELALKLSQIFPISAKLWLSIQNKAELSALQSQQKNTLTQLGLRDLLKKSA